MDFQNDEYTLNIDDLGDKKQIKNIRDLILEAKTPFSIGISGRWGSGKTSIMKYLMASLGGKPIKHMLNLEAKSLEEESEFDTILNEFQTNDETQPDDKLKNIHAIWFNPWENENHQEPMVGLLQSIHNYFSFRAKALKDANKLIFVSFQAGLNMIGSLLENFGTKGADTSNIKDIGEKYEYDNFQYIDRNQKFKFIFQEAIETLLISTDENNDNNKVINEIDSSSRVIIFIDDLDRCEDETISKLLKEIKQYLSTQRCIFIFGYDRHHIERSLSSSISKTSKETRAYLEKLFQTTFYIKEPKNDKLKDFTKNILLSFDMIDEPHLEDLTTFITEIIDPNPRRIKSYLTTLYFHIKSTNIENIDIKDLKKLALITYLKLFYEPVYSVLENDNEFLQDIVNACSKKDRTSTNNAKEYFASLELLSHIHNNDTTEFSDVATSNKSIIDKENEEKFLSEVYQMQGKHKNFDNFRENFAKLFKEELNIDKYL